MAEPESRKILIAVDGSEGGKKAYDFALSLSHPNDIFLVLNVVPHAREPFLAEEWAADRVLIESELTTRSANYLHSLEPEANTKRVKFTPLTRKGNARNVIIEVANEESVDMVVVGCRGHGGLKSLFLGSVSQWVVHHCSRPVLTVRQPSH